MASLIWDNFDNESFQFNNIGPYKLSLFSYGKWQPKKINLIIQKLHFLISCFLSAGFQNNPLTDPKTINKSLKKKTCRFANLSADITKSIRYKLRE